MRPIPALLATVVLFATPARADEGVHVALLAGLGLAQGQAGARLEVRAGHFALFAGTGLIASTTVDVSPLPFDFGDSYGGPGYGAVAGARWYSGDRGGRFFVSPLFAFNTQKTPGDPAEHQPGNWIHSSAATLTAGWQWKWSAFVIEAGAGGGLYFLLHSDKVQGSSHAQAAPDVTLALGFEL